MASPGNDVCDYHDYGYPTDSMGTLITLGPAMAIPMCHADGKPIMVVETANLAPITPATGLTGVRLRGASSQPSSTPEWSANCSGIG